MFKRIFRRLTSAICAAGVFAAGCVFSVTNVFAESAETFGSLTINGVSDETAVSGMKWKIYLAALRTDEGDYQLTGDFEQLPVDISAEMSASDLLLAAQTLEVYTKTDGFAPYGEAVSDIGGNAQFSQLEMGVYLISGESVTLDNVKYSPAPMLVEVSEMNELDVVCEAKFTTENIPVEPEPEKPKPEEPQPEEPQPEEPVSEEYSVSKVWKKDENLLEYRPGFVTVEIYCDGELAETVKLSEDNGWEYKWTSNEEHEWLVKETDVSNDYTVTYENGDKLFVINNTCRRTQGSKDHQNDDKPAPQKPVQPEEPKLPQTGQLWWPVPVLALGGLALVAIGLKLRSKKR